MDAPRCLGCGKKLAEYVRGEALFKCSRCNAMNEITVSVKVVDAVGK